MPNHDVVFDFHQHHDDHIIRTTGYAHIHDRHPYHQHDRNGSVIYIDPATCLLVELHPPDNNAAADLLDRVTHNHEPIGCGGSDYDRRTSPAAAGSVAANRH